MASPSTEAPPPAQTQSLDQPTPPTDEDQTRKPRDARLIQLVLSSLGVHSYQERVPLQLLDFAYRYTSSVLSDSLRLSAEGYASSSGPSTTTSRRGAGGANAGGEASGDGRDITVTALRQAIASRLDYTFRGPGLPKEFMREQAEERNRVQLPRVERSWGAQLPPERYCLTGTGWGISEEWDSEDDDVVDGLARIEAAKEVVDGDGGEGDRTMGGMEEQDDGEDEGGTFEDVFGGGEGDKEMGDG